MTDTAPVIVLGFYRGGTTLLQRQLNCFRDLTIWGEHSGFLREFARAYRAVRTSELKKVEGSAYSRFDSHAHRFVAWANGFDADEFLAWQRSSLTGLFERLPTRRWGFKEIRYNDLEMMSYLTALYPNCRILFLTRSPEDILISRVLVRWETRFQSAAEIRRYCLEFESEWTDALHAAACLRQTGGNLLQIDHQTLTAQRRLPRKLLDFLHLDERELDARLLNTVLDTRAGSSFGDRRNRRLTGREVASRVDCIKEFIAHSTLLRTPPAMSPASPPAAEDHHLSEAVRHAGAHS